MPHFPVARVMVALVVGPLVFSGTSGPALSPHMLAVVIPGPWRTAGPFENGREIVFPNVVPFWRSLCL